MGNYVCKKCGLGASSKCARSRSIFTENRNENLLSNILKYEIVKETPTSFDVALEWRYISKQHLAELGESPVEYVLKAIKLLSDEDIKHYACEHDWVLTAESCELGCCQKGE